MRAAEIGTRPRVENAEFERSIAIRQNASRHGVDRSVASTCDHRLITRRLTRKTRRHVDILQHNKIAFGQKRAKARQNAAGASTVRKRIDQNEEIAKGDYEQAKVAANDAIRAKNNVHRYRVLSSKIDTVVQRLKTAYQNQQLTQNMENLTKQLIGAGNMMDIVKMTETMSNFEKLFDDLDVQCTMTDQVMDNVNAGTVNEGEVNQLITQIAQQNGMKLSEDFDNVKIDGGEIAESGQQEQIGTFDGFPRA